MTHEQALKGMVSSLEETTFQRYKIDCDRVKLFDVLDYLDEQGFTVKAELNFGEKMFVTGERLVANQ